MIVYHSDDETTPIGGGPIGESSPPPPPPPADSPSSAPISGRSHRARWATALGAVLILATLLACDAGPDGSCRAPTPCGQNQGVNP